MHVYLISVYSAKSTVLLLLLLSQACVSLVFSDVT